MLNSKPIIKNNNPTIPKPDKAKQIESNQAESNEEKITVSIIVDRINKLKGLNNYDIRQLVKDAEYLGKDLKEKNLKTNQIRKFLDAINQIKINVIKAELKESEDLPPKVIDNTIMLQPKLAYAAGRKYAKGSLEGEAAKNFQGVLTAAINQVKKEKDFQRLVQLVESIIAYHKAAGGE